MPLATIADLHTLRFFHGGSVFARTSVKAGVVPGNMNVVYQAQPFVGIAAIADPEPELPNIEILGVPILQIAETQGGLLATHAEIDGIALIS